METLIDMIVRSTGEMTFIMMQRNEEPKNDATHLMAGLDEAHFAKMLVDATIKGWDFRETDGTRARLQVLSRWLMWVSLARGGEFSPLTVMCVIYYHAP